MHYPFFKSLCRASHKDKRLRPLHFRIAGCYSIKGKLDGRDDVIGKFSGQIMEHVFEPEGKRAELRLITGEMFAIDGYKLPSNA